VGRQIPIPEEALVQIYRATIKPLYAYISRRVGGDSGLAEDLAQETWMRALDAWPARGVPDEPMAWLIRVARNALVSHFRRVTPESVDPAIIDLESAHLSPETAEIAAVVSWGLARLRRGPAEVLEAYYFEGKSVKEIAQERSTSERAIEGRLRRARAKLKKKLEKLLPAHAPRRTESERRISHADQTRTP
jgi:RNA polymerase sigma factor (sigma-70 family)